jgi:hypothetical protein
MVKLLQMWLQGIILTALSLLDQACFEHDYTGDSGRAPTRLPEKLVYRHGWDCAFCVFFFTCVFRTPAAMNTKHDLVGSWNVVELGLCLLFRPCDSYRKWSHHDQGDIL